MYQKDTEFVEFITNYKTIELDENQRMIHSARRLGNETWKETAARLAYFGALATKQYPNDTKRSVTSDAKNFFKQIYLMRTNPATPVLLNAGSDDPQMFSCFGLVMPDDLKGIYEMLHLSGKIFSRAAGVGFNVSEMRPKGCAVSTHGATAVGVVKWLYLFFVNCQNIQTGTVGRRGAQAAILDYRHPDIFDYIKCKSNPKHFTNFNMSVILDGEFFSAVENDEMITCRTWKNEKPRRYSARRLMKLIVERAHFNGEPGLLFSDNVNKNNPIAHYAGLDAVNPCMEIPTVHYGSCNLGTINIMRLLNDDYSINYEEFEETIRQTVRYLDSLIDLNAFPDKKFERVEKHIRSIGSGIMGFADYLIKHKVPYDSEKAREIADTISAFKEKIEIDESEKIAESRGIAPVFEGTGVKRRNAFLSTYAPTGSVSMLSGCSASIEPMFALVMTKFCMDGTNFRYINEDFLQFMKTKNIPEKHMKVINEYVMTHGSIRNFYNDVTLHVNGDGFPVDLVSGQDFDIKEIRYWNDNEVAHFATAHDIHYLDKLKMQAAFQKHTDQAISSTLNFPKTATKEDVEKAFIQAYKLGLKGITAYRDGSRSSQILNTGTETGKLTWVCKSCGTIHQLDSDLDPEKVCIKCPSCGTPSCSQK